MSMITQMLGLPQPVKRTRAPQKGLHLGAKAIAKAESIFKAHGGVVDSLVLGRKMGYKNRGSGSNLGNRLKTKGLVEHAGYENINGRVVARWRWLGEQ